MSDLDVLVVGAGPTGLTMACELARRGVSIRIIDKLDKPTEHSKALVIHARTLELLHTMGCVEKFLELGIQITAVNVYDSSKKIAHLSLSHVDSPYPYSLGLPQNVTEALLHENLKEHGVDVERSCELVSIKEATDYVLAKINKSGVEEEIRCKYIVACDGAHSTVRREVKEPFEGGEYAETFQLADVQVDWGGHGARNELFAFSGEKGNAAFFPMPGDRFRVFTILTKEMSTADLDKEPTLDEVQGRVDDVLPFKVKLSDPHWLSNFRVRYRKVKNYRHGRVFLAGDAAHCHSPVGGQGMNTGMQDAFNLAWKLALAVNGRATEALLNSYQFERNAVAEQLLKSVDMLTRVNLLRAPIARELRNRLAPLLISHEMVQSRMRNFLTELGINYRRSPVVSEVKRSLVHAALTGDEDEPHLGDLLEFSLGPHAGDRALDSGVLDCTPIAVHLAGLFKSTKHNLLLFTGETPSSHTYSQLYDIAVAVHSEYGDYVDVNLISSEEEPTCELDFPGKRFSDPEYASHSRYGAGVPCLYLIRPDSYVGFRSQPPELEGVDQYFKKILKL